MGAGVTAHCAGGPASSHVGFLFAGVSCPSFVCSWFAFFCSQREIINLASLWTLWVAFSLYVASSFEPCYLSVGGSRNNIYDLFWWPLNKIRCCYDGFMLFCEITVGLYGDNTRICLDNAPCLLNYACLTWNHTFVNQVTDIRQIYVVRHSSFFLFTYEPRGSI